MSSQIADILSPMNGVLLQFIVTILAGWVHRGQQQLGPKPSRPWQPIDRSNASKRA